MVMRSMRAVSNDSFLSVCEGEEGDDVEKVLK
jgi:hypothetical protein